jgi:hypothetical protein
MRLGDQIAKFVQSQVKQIIDGAVGGLSKQPNTPPVQPSTTSSYQPAGDGFSTPTAPPAGLPSLDGSSSNVSHSSSSNTVNGVEVPANGVSTLPDGTTVTNSSSESNSSTSTGSQQNNSSDVSNSTVVSN